MIGRAQIEGARLAVLHWQVREPRIVLVRQILQARCLTQLSSRVRSHSSYLTQRLIISRCLTLTASFSLSHSHCPSLIASLSLPLLQGTLVRSRLVACCCWPSSEYHCRSTRRDFEATSERDRVVQTPIECIATCAKNSRTCGSSTEQRQC